MPGIDVLQGDVLADVIDALRYSLKKVTEEEMRTTTQMKAWEQVHSWVEEADAALKKENAGSDKTCVPRFPVTGSELRALQRAMDTVVQQRGKAARAGRVSRRSRQAQSARFRKVVSLRSHLGDALGAVRHMSLMLMSMLTVTLALNVAYLVFVDKHEIAASLAGTDLLLASLAVIAWIEHRHRLRHAAWGQMWQAVDEVMALQATNETLTQQVANLQRELVAAQTAHGTALNTAAI